MKNYFDKTLFLVCGLSGSGKSTFIKELRKDYNDMFKFIGTYSTREIRDYENNNSIDTILLSNCEFEKRKCDYIGKKADRYSGIRKNDIFAYFSNSNNVFLIANINWIETIKNDFYNIANVKTILIASHASECIKRISYLKHSIEQFKYRITDIDNNKYSSFNFDYFLHNNGDIIVFKKSINTFANLIFNKK